MSKRDAELIRRHTPHGWVTSMSMATIQRVPRAETEQIMACPCGWYGWVSRDALSASNREVDTSIHQSDTGDS